MIEVVEYDIPLARDVGTITPLQQQFLANVHRMRQEKRDSGSSPKQEEPRTLVELAKERMNEERS